MSKIYGYCRISRKTQRLERQRRNILSLYPEAKIYEEAYTGTKIEGRKELEKLLNVVKKGDTIVFDSVSRMSRNANDGIELYMRLFHMGVNLVFLKEPYINTDTYKLSLNNQIPMMGTDEDLLLEGINKYLTRLAERQIQIAFEQAQKEVDDLHTRTAEGLLTAKQNGKRIGTEPGRKLTTKKSKAAKELIQKHSRDFGGSLTDTEVIKLCGIAMNSYYKYKKELKIELEKGEA